MTFIKWVGGKSFLKNKIINFFPKDYEIYIEPFLGSGAIFFELNPKKAILSDINEGLINSFIQVRDNIEILIKELKKLQEEYILLNQDQRKIIFNEKKNQFNKIKFNINENKIQCAILFIFLNKTGFNGMYRENKNGLYNIPIGKQPKICIIDEKKIMECHYKLQNKEIYHMNYKQVFELIKNLNNKLIYLDPPYFINENNKFTNYNSVSFGNKEQEELKNYFDNSKNSFIFQSNSYSDKVLDLYKNYQIEVFNVKRQINSKVEERKKIKQEILIIKND